MLGIGDRSRRWWVLAAAGSAMGLIVLDETVVGVALPSIQQDLGMSEVTSHWVVNSYLVAFAGFVAVGGRLSDIFGHGRIFVIGAILFGAGSLASGFAGESAVLVAARAGQGLGAAMVFPTSLALTTLAFPREQRGLALGIYSAIASIFMTLGPVVGGGLTEALSWRWIFWINQPVIVVVIVIMLAAWREPERPGARPSVDFWGLSTLVVGLAGLTLGLMRSSVWGWGSPETIAVLAAGAASLAVFWRIELRLTQPLLDVRLFRSGTFSGANLVMFVMQFTRAATIVFLPLYLQQVLDVNAFEAGLALLPATIPLFVAALLAGRVSDRLGPRRPTLAGLVALAAALAWLGFGTSTDSYWILVPGLLLWGTALPFLFAPPQAAVMSSVPEQKHGEAGGISSTTRMIGGAMGIAVFSTLLTNGANYPTLFLLGAGVTLIVLLLALRLINPPDPRRAPRQTACPTAISERH